MARSSGDHLETGRVGRQRPRHRDGRSAVGRGRPGNARLSFASVHLAEFLTLVIVFVAGCDGTAHTPGPGEPARGGTMRLFVAEGLNSLDPRDAADAYARRITRLIFEPIRDVIESAQVENATEILLTLRDDAYFHDDPCFVGGQGRRVIARDVAFTLDRLAAPGSQARWVLQDRVAGAARRHAGLSEHVAGIELLSERQVRLRLVRPFYPMLSILGQEQCGVVPREAVVRYGERFAFHPVGSGPFRLAKWIEGDELILVRNSRYQRRDGQGRVLPHLDRIRMTYVRPPLGQWNEFMSGRIDQCQVPNELVDRIVRPLEPDGWELAPEVAVKGWLGYTKPRVVPFVVYLGVNCGSDNPVARSPVLRRALAMSLDRVTLTRLIGSDMKAATSLLPPGFPGHTARKLLQPYDPDEARRLLAASGHADGSGVPVLSLYVAHGRGALVSALRDQLADIGIRVRVLEVSFNDLMAAIRRGEADLFLSGMTSSTFLHPEGFLAQFRGEVGPVLNKFRFRSPEYDTAYERAGAAENARQRMAWYAVAEAILLEQLPVIPIAWVARPSFFVTSNRVRLPANAPATDLVHAWIVEPGG
ncbi:MAG: ABC transporter substrate-binding protein [Phycisphaerae bacterium]